MKIIMVPLYRNVVNDKLLLNTLAKIGCSKTALKLFALYLSNGKQSVKTDTGTYSWLNSSGIGSGSSFVHSFYEGCFLCF